MEDRSLDVLRNKVREEAGYVDKKPYSHNIVGMLLSEIDDLYGEAEAQKAITDFGLDKMGW